MRTRCLFLVGLLAPGCLDYHMNSEKELESAPEERIDLDNIEDGTVNFDDTGTTDESGDGEVFVGSCDCPESYTVSDDGGSCVRTETFPATPRGEVVEVCPIEPFRTYGAYGAMYPDGTNVKNEYWGQNDSDLHGRLNEVGVWGCEYPGASTAGHDPIDTWIGFTVCLDVEEPGDYLVGFAGDNRVRLSVDGERLHEQTGEDMHNFKYWWMESMALDAGNHRIDIEGYNAGSIAAFGAEVAGPFESGSLQTDEDMIAADYEGNIMWSTADAVGSAFPLGETTRWTCPDGTTFQGCDVPVCEEVVEEIPCR